MLKNISLTFASKVLIGVLNLLVVILLSRYLGAAGKGQATLVLTSVTMFLIACNVVGGATLVYLVPRYNTNTLLLISYLWTIVSCTAVYIIVHYLSILPIQFEKHVFVLAMIDSFFSINSTILLGREKIKLANILAFTKAVSVAIILVLFLTVFKENSVNAYISTLYFSFSISFLVSFIFVLNNRTTIESGKNFKELLLYCFRLGGINQLGHILQFASLRLSYYLLSRFSGDGQLGVYSNGVSLAESVWLISNSISTVQYAKIANMADNEQSVKLTVRLTKMSLLICLAAVIVMALLPTAFYTSLFGPEFLNVKEVIYTLIPGVLFYNIALIVGHYFSGIGKYEVEVWGNFAGLLVTLGLSAIAILSGYSPIWAGLISSASYLMTSLVIVTYFYKHNQIKPGSLIPRISDIKDIILK
jgi:O-antigen/teichoic acid export membrane protein